MVSRLITAWQLVAKRSLAHWRLLSSVVIGVLMASAIMAGTVIYYDSLRGLALKNTLSKLTSTETDILVKADRGPTSYREYEKVAAAMNGAFDAHVAWLLKDRIRGGKTATFFLTPPGDEDHAGDDDARAYFAFLPRLTQHITLLPGGRLPQEQALNTPGEPLELEAIIPAKAADEFGVGVGDRLSAVPHWDDAIPYATVVISGIFDREEPEEEFWDLDDTIFRASTLRTVRAIPFYISENTFMEVLGAAFHNMDSSYGWLLDVGLSRVNAGNASSAQAGIDLMEARLSTDLLGYRQVTSLDEALADYDKRLFFSKIPMFVILILMAVVILYYVVTLSSLLVEQQSGEIALLRSRGASSTQILTVFVVEGATISILAIIVAPLLAAIVIGILGFTPAFSDLSSGERLPVSISGGAYMMSALGGLLSFGALIIPAFRASRIGVTRHRQQTARPSGQPFYQRYYLDVMLLVLSVILFRQLDEQGSVVATGVFGETTVDQILLAVPALILVAFGLVLLRLYPLTIRFLSGDSPALLHLVVAGTVLILAPSIAINQAVNGDGLMWLAQVALLAALAGTYRATSRTTRMSLKAGGMTLQAGVIATILTQGPALPLEQVFDPVLIAIVPAQAAFILFKALSQRAPVGVSMGLWQMARNPTHYARLSLLLILMAGLGILAASFGGTLQRSFEERALYSTGADIRLEEIVLNVRGRSRPVVESYEELPGVEQVSPAYRRSGSDLSHLFGESFVMLGIAGESFKEVAWFRDDFSDKPIEDLLASLAQPEPPQGIELPMNSTALGVRVRPDRPHPSVVVDARIRDTNGRYFTYPLGSLASFDWQVLETQLDRPQGSRRRPPLQPVQPLTLVSLSVHEARGTSRLRAGSMTIDEISVRTIKAESLTVEPFDDVAEWSVLSVVPQAFSDALQVSSVNLNGDSGAARFIWTAGTPLTSRGIYHGPPTSPLPVLASEPFLSDTGHSLGTEFQVSVGGHRLPVRVVGSIDYFPTLDTVNKRESFNRGRFLISDLPSLSNYTNLDARSGEFRTTEIWLSTKTTGSEREQLLERLSEGVPFRITKIHDRAAAQEASQVDPLVDAGWRALLVIAFSAVLLLSVLGFLVHAYVSFRTRETEFGLMRTIGFSMKQLITLVWLEQALVIAAGLALGTWVGRELGATVMPFLSHDDQGIQVLPPFAMEVSWGALAITYVAMALVFALITTGVIWFIRRISLRRILRLGEM